MPRSLPLTECAPATYPQGGLLPGVVAYARPPTWGPLSWFIYSFQSLSKCHLIHPMSKAYPALKIQLIPFPCFVFLPWQWSPPNSLRRVCLLNFCLFFFFHKTVTRTVPGLWQGLKVSLLNEWNQSINAPQAWYFALVTIPTAWDAEHRRCSLDGAEVHIHGFAFFTGFTHKQQSSAVLFVKLQATMHVLCWEPKRDYETPDTRWAVPTIEQGTVRKWDKKKSYCARILIRCCVTL